MNPEKQLPSGSWCPHLSNLHSTKRGCRDPTCDLVNSMTGERCPSAVYQIPGVSRLCSGCHWAEPYILFRSDPLLKNLLSPKTAEHTGGVSREAAPPPLHGPLCRYLEFPSASSPPSAGNPLQPHLLDMLLFHHQRRSSYIL